MALVQQCFSDKQIIDVESETRKTLNKLILPETLNGKRIAITAGSRMFSNMVEIYKTIANWVLEQGAIPFFVPAMGSHGGATAEGHGAHAGGRGLRHLRSRPGAPGARLGG